jgi:two-component system, chemotaxis family, chemotaxis protein CheY
MSLPFDTGILVVDDFESMRRILKQVLGDIGFRSITLAPDGATALALLEKGEFGLLITDWDMPGMEGIELVAAVRADPRLAAMPILMVSAEAQREKILRAARAGVSDYLVKPFTPDMLRASIERIFLRRVRQ